VSDIAHSANSGTTHHESLIFPCVCAALTGKLFTPSGRPAPRPKYISPRSSRMAWPTSQRAGWKYWRAAEVEGHARRKIARLILSARAHESSPRSIRSPYFQLNFASTFFDLMHRFIFPVKRVNYLTFGLVKNPSSTSKHNSFCVKNNPELYNNANESIKYQQAFK